MKKILKSIITYLIKSKAFTHQMIVINQIKVIYLKNIYNIN
jgi:hypothetical protein